MKKIIKKPRISFGNAEESMCAKITDRITFIF